MRAIAAVVLWASVSACVAKGGEPRVDEHDADTKLAPGERVEPMSSSSAATPGHAARPRTSLTIQPRGPVEYRVPPLLDSGVPAVSRGHTIRLQSLEVGTRMVGALEVASVAIADLESRAALDELLLRHAQHGRCEVMLALETFVSLRCAAVHMQMGAVQRDHHIAHFELGTGGDVHEVEVWALFHAGEEAFNMTRRLVHDPGAGARRVVASELGIELSYPFDGEVEIDRLPWRAIAPYMRMDGPLGPVLIAAGLPLAPADTKLPIAPISPALWADSERALLEIWAAAPPQVRARARLATTGGHNPAGLLFAPDIGAGEVAKLEGRSRSVERGVGFYTDLPPLVVAVRTRAPVQLREQPGSDQAVLEAVPEQTVLTSIDGLVHRLDSAPGSEGWAYVVTREGSAGWVGGQELEVLGASYGVDAPAADGGDAVK